MDFKKEKVKELFKNKCEIKGIEFKGMEKIFLDDIEEILAPYWEREPGRLLNPLPDMQVVLGELKAKLDFLEL